MDWILSFFTGGLSDVIPWIIGAFGALAAVFMARKSGANRVENKIRKDQDERAEKGRRAVAREIEETEDASREELVDRIRKNSGEW